MHTICKTLTSQIGDCTIVHVTKVPVPVSWLPDTAYRQCAVRVPDRMWALLADRMWALLADMTQQEESAKCATHLRDEVSAETKMR